MAADAQSTFTERLQKSNTGEGKISVTHDKSIDELVNGPAAIKQPQKEKPEPKATVVAKPKEKPVTTEKAKSKEKEKPTTTEKAKPVESEAQTVITPDTVDMHKKMMKGYKVTGYRVQVFAGGNSRNDRLKAERTGDHIKSLFPDEPIYVHFYSPRWICRMGNYRTYEEAHEILKKVKQMGYQSAIIVKGKITVQY
jgi:cell division septation protein DedD